MRRSRRRSPTIRRPRSRLAHEALERRELFAVEAYQVTVLTGMLKEETGGTVNVLQPLTALTSPVVAASKGDAILAAVTGTVEIPSDLAAGTYSFPSSRFKVGTAAQWGVGDRSESTWVITFEDWFDNDYNDWYWSVQVTPYDDIPIDISRDGECSICSTGVAGPTGYNQSKIGMGVGPMLQRTAPGGSIGSSSPFGNGWAADRPQLRTIARATGLPETLSVVFNHADKRIWHAVGTSGSFERAARLATTDSLT